MMEETRASTSNNDTPLKPKLSSHHSTSAVGYTHESIDEYLEADLKEHTHTVTLDEFLTHAMDFEVEPGRQAIDKWDIGNTDDYKNLLQTYNLQHGETDRYKPFAALANHVVHQFQLAHPDFRNSQNWEETKLHFRPMGSTYLGGDFGKRKPDLVGVHDSNQVGSLNWWETYFVAEFKKKRTGKKDATAKGASGSGNKRAISGEGGRNTSKKPRLTVSGQPPMNSEEAAMSHPSSSAQADAPQPNPPNQKYLTTKVELANYALQMMSSGNFREWVVSFVIDENQLTLWYYDRTCAISAEPFNWKDEWAKFVMCLVALSTCSRKQFGFDTLFTPLEKLSVYGGELKSIPFKAVVGEAIDDVDKIPLTWGTDTAIRLEKRIHKQFTLFGRGTIVDDITVGKMDGEVWVPQSEVKLVMKILWHVQTRKKEHEIIELARTIDREHTPVVFAHATLERTLPSDELRKTWNAPPDDQWERRVLVILISRKYTMAYTLKGADFMKVYLDSLICHRRLYLKAKILHRDVSASNLMAYKDRNSTWIGVLADFDLSVILDSDNKNPGPTSKHRTGTTFFMARELLLQNKDIEQCYAHDLESFLYVFLWVALGYDGRTVPTPLAGWAARNWGTVREKKNTFFIDYATVIRGLVLNHNGSWLVLKKGCEVFIDASIAASRAIRTVMQPPPLSETFDSEEDPAMTRAGHDVYKQCVTWERYARAVEVSQDIIRELADDIDEVLVEDVPMERL